MINKDVREVENNLNSFAVDYEADSGQNYLLLKRDGLSRNEIIGFQVEMISNNKLHGIVPFTITEKNSQITMRYQLTGKINLNNYLKRKKIDKVEFITLLERIIAVIIDSKKNFLNEQSFVINENFIYVKSSGEVELIYLPVKVPGDIVQSFKDFAVDLVITGANIETQDNFVQEILKLLKYADSNLNDITRRLRTMKGTEAGSVPESESGSGTRTKLEVRSEYLGESCSNLNSIRQDTLKKKNVAPPPIKTKQSTTATRTLILGIMATVIVLAAIISSLLDKLAVLQLSSGRHWYFTVGLILIGGFLTLVILVNRQRKHRSYMNQNNNHSNGVNMFKVEIENDPLEFEPLIAATKEANVDETTFLGIQTDETVLLEETKYPFLRTTSGDTTILINKSEFTIGRNGDTCDYVVYSKNVGRAHVQIVAKDSNYYLVDLDSKNGTYLNGQRIVSNKQYQLTNDDRISLAEIDFYFEL